MPISLSAKKSLRKSLKNHKENVAIKNGLKKLVKEYLANPNQESLKKVFSALDKTKKKFIFHRNKVSRLKSKYAKAMDNKAVKVVVKKAKKTKKVSKKINKKTTKKMK